MTHSELQTDAKSKVGDVIIKVNLIEKTVKQILSRYISSPHTDFVNDVLLNNMITNLSVKIKLLRHILVEEGHPMDKKLQNSLHVLLNKRNVLAHSESLLDTWDDLVDVGFDYNNDAPPSMYGILETQEPDIPIYENDSVNYEKLSKVISDFEKHYKLCEEGLLEIEKKLFD